MPRFRFSVAWMAAAVAVVALVLSVTLSDRRDARRREMGGRGYWHKDQAFKIHLYYLESYEREYGPGLLASLPGDYPDILGTAEWNFIVAKIPTGERYYAERLATRHAYHKRMQGKWEAGAMYPVFRVPADLVMSTADYDPLPGLAQIPSRWAGSDY